MLSIHFGDLDSQINYIDSYFNNNYDDNWIESETVQSIIFDIDKCTYLGDNLFKHEVLGLRRIEDMSGGCKCLILVLMRDDLIIRGSNMGNNCVKWIQTISSKKNVNISLGYIMDLNPRNFEGGIYCINTKSTLKTRQEYVNTAVDFLCYGGDTYCEL